VVAVGVVVGVEVGVEVAVGVAVAVAALSFARNLVPPDGGTAVAVEP
jgi:hypothetical protein